MSGTGNIVAPGREYTAFASAARTATPAAFEFKNYIGRGLFVVIDVTAIVSTPSVVFSILGKDPVSGKTFVILASAAIATVSTVILRVSPDLTAAANLIAKDMAPVTCQITPVHGNANSITYTVSAICIP